VTSSLHLTEPLQASTHAVCLASNRSAVPRSHGWPAPMDLAQLLKATGAERESDMALARNGAVQLHGGAVVAPPHRRRVESDTAGPARLLASESGRHTLDLTAGRVTPAGPPCPCLHVRGVSLTIDQRLTLLRDTSFSARPGTLTAIIGPSGAGKSTLARLVAGAAQPTTGAVTLDGHDIHSGFSALRTRIGLVPQDDLVHRQLTVEQALSYAAQLRLPPHTTKEDRRRAVARVLDELELTEHAATRVDKLSGGQRKRASVAMELLTGASLLILDEPTSGLDPALDRQVMTMLRQLADAGRVVLVVTHSLTYLQLCDQVLLLAPGGKTAFCGPPDQIGRAMGTTDWADIFTKVSAERDAVKCERVARHCVASTAAHPPPARLPHTGFLWQLSTIARRQIRLVLADRGYLIFLALLPFVLGALSLMVPGNAGLGVTNPRGRVPDEAAQILMLLNTSAVFMGVALTIRDLVGERAIFRREQSVGLSAYAYLGAKIVVFSVAACIQVAILTAIVVLGKGGPTRGAAVAGSATVELYLTLAATAVVAVILGLTMSSLAKSNEQILPMLVVSIMASMVFSGALIPVTGRLVLNEMSWIVPARWGFAATASTADLRNITPFMPQNETLWSHTATCWLFDMSMLSAQGVLLAAFVRWRICLRPMCAPMRSARHRQGAPTLRRRRGPAQRPALPPRTGDARRHRRRLLGHREQAKTFKDRPRWPFS
jgi:ABC transport system ATP-binding/permease protein